MPRICRYDSRWPSDYVELDYGQRETINDIVKALCHLTGTDYDKLTPVLDPQGRSSYDKEGKLITERVHIRLEELFERKHTTTISGRNHFSGLEWGVWHDWGFFRVKGFKRGTMHFEFKDLKVLDMFNRRVAELKGWQLPKARK